MKRLIPLLIILALAIACGLLIANHPAIIHIETGSYHISMSLWVGMIAILILYTCILLFYRLLKGSIRIPKRLTNHVKTRRAQQARRNQNIAFRLAMQGQWQQAANKLQQAGKKSQHPALCYLASAQCAYQIGKYECCLKDLKKAQNENGDSALIHLMHARVLSDQGKTVEAKKLLMQHANLPEAAAQLTRLALQSEKGDEALLHLKQASNALSISDQENASTQALTLKLHHVSNTNNADALKLLWREHKRMLTAHVHLHAAYLSALVDCGQTNTARKVLIKTLKKSWDEAYLSVFEKTNSADNLPKSITLAEAWLSDHADSPALHALLGALYLKNRKSQKAIDHLKQAHAIAPSSRLAYQLGQAYSQVGSLEEALRWYARGCESAA